MLTHNPRDIKEGELVVPQAACPFSQFAFGFTMSVILIQIAYWIRTPIIDHKMERQYLSNKPLHYAKISLDKRMKLVDMVINKQIPVSKASKKIEIKLSTAKLILKKFKQEASFFQSRAQKKKRITENYPNSFATALPSPFPGQFIPPMMSVPRYEQQFMMMPPYPMFPPQHLGESMNMLSNFPQLMKNPTEIKSPLGGNPFWPNYPFPNGQ